MSKNIKLLLFYFLLFVSINTLVGQGIENCNLINDFNGNFTLNGNTENCNPGGSTTLPGINWAFNIGCVSSWGAGNGSPDLRSGILNSAGLPPILPVNGDFFASLGYQQTQLLCSNEVIFHDYEFNPNGRYELTFYHAVGCPSCETVTNADVQIALTSGVTNNTTINGLGNCDDLVLENPQTIFERNGFSEGAWVKETLTFTPEPGQNQIVFIPQASYESNSTNYWAIRDIVIEECLPDDCTLADESTKFEVIPTNGLGIAGAVRLETESCNARFVVWSFGDGTTEIDRNPGASSIVTHSFKECGRYEVCIGISNECEDGEVCTIERCEIVNFPCNPEDCDQLEVSGEHQNTSCPGATGSVDLTVTGGSAPYTFIWTNGATTEDIQNLDAGDYTVTVTDANGCTARHFFRITNIESDIVISGEHQDSACEDTGSIELTVSGGIGPYSYKWSHGSFSPILLNLAPGDYTVTVTDSNGCTASHFFRIKTIESDDIRIFGVHQNTCGESSTGSIDISIAGGIGPYSYEWSHGASTGDIDGLSPGDYTVTVTDSNGCTASHFFRIKTGPLGTATCEDFNYKGFRRATGTSNNSNMTFTSGISGTISVLLEAQCIPDELFVNINGTVVLQLSAGGDGCDGQNNCNGNFDNACGEFCVNPCDVVNIYVVNNICTSTSCGTSTAWDLTVTCEEKKCDIQNETARQTQTAKIEKRFTSNNASEERHLERMAIDVLKLYPNPVTDVLNLMDLNPIAGYQTARIINSSGVIVLTEKISGLNNLRVDVGSFSQGIYIIEITDKYGSKLAKKFIKM